MLKLIALSCGALVMTTTVAATQTVSQATNFQDFSEKFCSVSRDGEHIFVVPVAVLTEQKSIKCDDGESKLQTTEPKDDPGHIVFNIDPPHGSKASLDCDGKADIDMTTVAINCLPVSQESMEHPKE